MTVPDSPSASPLTHNDAVFFPIPRELFGGAVTINVFALLSTFALVSLAVRVFFLAIRRLLSHRSIVDSKEYAFFSTQLGNYAACLLIANALSSVAGLMGLVSLARGGILQDGLCTTQAVMQFANVSSAYYTVAIAIHTFSSLVLRRRQAPAIVSMALLLGWVLAAVICSSGQMYGVAGLTCGVREVYKKQQFFLHILPIFAAAFLSALFFALTFLVLRGILVVKGGLRLQFNSQERTSMLSDSYHQFVTGIATSMLWFPIAYLTFLIPYSVTRLLSMIGFEVPFQAMVFAFVCWFMLGVANVLLLYNTFRVLGPAFDGGRSSMHKDVEKSPSSASFASYPQPIPRLMSPSGSPVSMFQQEKQRPVSVASYYAASQWHHEHIVPPSQLNGSIYTSPLSRGHGRDDSISSDTSARSAARTASVTSLVGLLPTPPRPTHPASMPRKTSVDSILTPPVVPMLVQTSPGQTVSPIARSVRQSNGLLQGSEEQRLSAASVDSETRLNEISGWLARHGQDGSMHRTMQSQASASPTSISSNSRMRELKLVTGGSGNYF